MSAERMMVCRGCAGEMVLVVDAIGRPSRKGPQCPRCDRVPLAQQGSIIELRGWSQTKHAPPVPPLTLPKHRPALVLLPQIHAFVEVPERPAPQPSRYVPNDAETHPSYLPADHPRRIAYIAILSEKQKAARARKREALQRPAEPAKPARVRREYEPRTCAFEPCGKQFIPTGPRSKFCEVCR